MRTHENRERSLPRWSGVRRRALAAAVTARTTLLLMALASAPAIARAGEGAADEAAVHEPARRRHVLSNSAFMFADLLPGSPSFYQLNYGYQLTPEDVLFVEAITWTYSAPLGIPYWASSDAPDRSYPGSVREYGVGLAYQRYLWRGLYAGLHATPFVRQYLDPGRHKLQTGFQLFLTLRTGYHVPLFGDRFFVEPSLACTYWPIKTNVPAAFARVDRKWPNYFLFEPGLHLGVTF